jgi:hypothetical protein
MRVLTLSLSAIAAGYLLYTGKGLSDLSPFLPFISWGVVGGALDKDIKLNG